MGGGAVRTQIDVSPEVSAGRDGRQRTKVRRTQDSGQSPFGFCVGLRMRSSWSLVSFIFPVLFYFTSLK